MLPLLLLVAVVVAVVAVARVVFVICVHFGICFMAMRHAIQNRIVTTSPADKPTDTASIGVYGSRSSSLASIQSCRFAFGFLVVVVAFVIVIVSV